MGYIKINGVNYLEELLTDEDRKQLGLVKKNLKIDEKKILEELKNTSDKVKKNRVAKSKEE